MNPQMLTLLRESRGMSGAKLARVSGVPQPTLSKAENNRALLDDVRLASVAEALDYPAEVFSWTDSVYGFGSYAFYHRKQQTLPVTMLRQVQAHVNLVRMRLVRLLRGVEVDHPAVLPDVSADEVGSPALVARLVRALWALPMGPITNMSTALERAGVVVVRYDLTSPKISAISMGPIDAAPAFIVLNDGMPADRERFTLAHELGHLVMHTGASHVANAEEEADAFASEFLMPAAEIQPQLVGLDIYKAFELKQYWRVSGAAIIRRARDLGQITDARYRSLNVIRSQRGWSKNEPYPFSRDEPTLLGQLVRVHLEDHEYDEDELAGVVGLFTPEFRERLPVPGDGKKRHLRLV